MEIRITETLVSQPSWIILCFSVGTLSVLRLFLSILRGLYSFLRPSKNVVDFGKWAVVTGPTDGIGKAMAFELARRGLNLVLVGRNPIKLSQLCAEMKAQVPSVELKTVVMDFAEDIGEGIRELKGATKDVDVGILLNNAGLMQTAPTFLHEIDGKFWSDIINVNVVVPTIISTVLLPGMLERRKGAIINIGSGNTTIPAFPLFSVYSSTKRYIRCFSKCLHTEYRQRGIHVQCQIPWIVATKMVPTFKPSMFVPTPSQYANSALRCVGYGSEVMPYWSHVLQTVLMQFPADFIMNWATFKSLMDVRNQMKRQGV
ncbi:very-long-chain 3-oxoacyl-CoA reductase 1-like [Wolffia australiana]